MSEKIAIYMTREKKKKRRERQSEREKKEEENRRHVFYERYIIIFTPSTFSPKADDTCDPDNSSRSIRRFYRSIAPPREGNRS